MNKNINRILFFLALMMVVITTQAQSPVEDVTASIRVGSLPGISRYMDNAVSINIKGSQSTYSKPQAEMVLKDFFNKNVPKDFSIEHSGGGTSTKFCIGTLVTSTGNFRAYISFKLSNNNYVLQELRFEK